MEDCVIVGGGFAGTSCALVLARHRWKVLMVDGGPPRNFASHCVNGFIGHQGAKPLAILERAHSEAIAAGARIQRGVVENVTGSNDRFEVTVAGRGVSSRRIVLAYGVRDEIPEISGLRQLLGNGVHHCPTCDGPDVSGDHAIALGPAGRAAGLALELLQWAARVTLITHGEPFDVAPDVRKKMAEHPIDVITHRVERVKRGSGSALSVALESGTTLEARALFFTYGTVRNSAIAESLGCALNAATDTISVDEHLASSVPGVYAIGDLIAGPQLVIRAAADGAHAALSIHKSLLPMNRSVG